MSIALATGLFAALAWGIVDVVAAVAGRRLGVFRTVVIEQIGSLIGLTLFALIVPSAMGPTAGAGILAAIPMGLISSVGFICQFAALRLGPVSVVGPLVGSYGGFTVVLAILLRGELLQPLQALGAVLATAGVVLTGVVFHGGSLRGAKLVGPGVIAAVVSALAFATTSVLLAGPIHEYGSSAAVAGSRIGNFVLTGVIFGAASLTGVAFFRPLLAAGPLVRRLVALVMLAGMGDIAGFLAFGVGLDIGPVWLVGLVSSFGPVLAIVYGLVWLHERLHLTQWIGMLLIGVSLVLLAVAG